MYLQKYIFITIKLINKMKKILNEISSALFVALIAFSAFMTWLVAPSTSKHQSKYNDGNDYAISHQIHDNGIKDTFKKYSILFPGALCYVALDKKWNGELKHLGLIIIIASLFLMSFFYSTGEKHWIGGVLGLCLNFYFLFVFISMFMSIINNNYNW